jgi:hypothetical protein
MLFRFDVSADMVMILAAMCMSVVMFGSELDYICNKEVSGCV